MNAFMPRELARLGKSSITPFEVALEGLFSCVDEAVNGKLTRVSKRRFATSPLALAGLVVGLPCSLLSAHSIRRVVV